MDASADTSRQNLSLKSNAAAFRRGLAGVAVIAALWWFLPADGAVLLPPLGQVLNALLDLVETGQLLRDIWHSTFRVIAGVLTAVGLATALGMAALVDRRSVDYAAGVFELLRPVPPIAWTPVAILLFGIGWAPAVAIVALSAFFPMWLSLLKGIDGVKKEHLIAANCLGASRMVLFTDVLVPSILPYFAHGVRLAVGFGWFSVIAAEMVGASSGLGHALQSTSLNLEMSKTYGYLLVIGLIGVASSLLLLSATAPLGSDSDG